MKSFIALVFSVFLVFSTTLQAKEVLLVSDPWPPYLLGEMGGEITGGTAHTALSEIFNGAGLELKTLLCPWKRCLALIEKGDFDGGIFLGKNAEREAYMDFSDAIVEVPTVIWHRKDKKVEWNSWEDLTKHNMVIIPSYNYGNEFKQAREKHKFKLMSGKTEKENLMKVLEGKADCMPGNKVVIQNLINNTPEFKDKFTYSQKPLTVSSYHMSFTKKKDFSNELNKINEQIKKLKDSGRLEAIFYGK